MRSWIWTFVITLVICGTGLAQDSGRSTVQCDTPVPLSETGVRFPWETEPENSPFRAGSWTSQLIGAAIFGVFADDVRMYSVFAGMGYYFQDNVSLSMNIGTYYGDRNVNRDTQVDTGEFVGASLDAIMRCHVFNYGSWSAFVEGGLGVAYLSERVPDDGTKYNFILTAGFGITKQISECTHFIGGCRWHHFSNGAFFNSGAKNPGYDGKMIYAGLLYSY